MTRFQISSLIAIVILAFGVVGSTWADDSPTPGNAAVDVVRGAVDPYEPGYERSRFLAAAGVDSELDEAEFKANKDAKDPFVRAYDAWPTMKLFDKNRNSALDWFEVDQYRRSVRKAVLGQFDKDKNSRLTGEERDAANKLLAAGRTPKLDLPKTGSTPNVQTQPRPGGLGQRIQWDLDGDGKFSDEERKVYQKKMRERYAEMQKEYIRKYDKDGDGKVTGDEWKAANEARMKAWREQNPEAAKLYDERMAKYKKQQEEQIRKYDKNGDGKLTGSEWDGVREEQMEAWKQRDPEGYERYQKRMADYVKQHDSDGDGKLSTEERQAAYAKQREQWQQQQAERIKKYDKDGDGKLNREESEAARKEWYEDWKARNPEAAKRYEERRKQWEERRKNGQGGTNIQPGQSRVIPLQDGAGIVVGGAGGVVIPQGDGAPGRVIYVNPNFGPGPESNQKGDQAVDDK